jgi:chemotaxis signal transduction protein
VKISQSRPQASTPRRAQETVILFSAGGVHFAIAARAVEEIRESAGLKSFLSYAFQDRFAKVKHTLDRQGKATFVVDACTHFRIPEKQPARVMILRHAPAALAVESIDGMKEIYAIHNLPVAFTGEERNWYRGLTLIEGRVVPVVRPEAFLSKAETVLLAAASPAERKESKFAVAAR